nr:tyrosine-type recombinase/integrase [Eubacterium sp.]
LKPKAADRRESTIRNQIEPYLIGKLQITSIKPQDVNNHIEKLINEGKLSVSSITKTLDVINSAYNWANDQAYYTDFNPCKPVMDKLKTRLRNLEKRNSSSGVVRILSDEQIKIIEEYVEHMNKDPSYYYITGLSSLLLLYTGMRQGEMCALKWSDYDNITNTLSISKTRNVAKNRATGEYIPNENEVKNYHSRDIVLSDDAKMVIDEIKRVSVNTDQDDYIIYNKVYKPTNPSNYGYNLNKFYLKAGLPTEISGAHILRRTCATKMHREGCRVEDIAAYLGDTPETIIKHYISLTKKVVAEGRVLNVVNVPKGVKKE